MIRTAVIGMGNMGSRYTGYIASGMVPGMSLSAVTRVSPEKLLQLEEDVGAKIPVYNTADELLDSFTQGEIALDAVIIATPHYSYEQMDKIEEMIKLK